ncbi:MAG TPA: phosphoribosylanthranilate isomerase [Opitutaceae bacterium]|nr:phosphoribosylanthranilate isomerase [Opitutaceae bacterium]
MKQRVKICGVTRVRDARLAVSLGATMIGCVLAADSARRATISQARAIVRAVGGIVPVVLVYREATQGTVLDACARTGATTVQLHDCEEAQCVALEAAGLRVIRVRRMDTLGPRLPAFAPAPGPRRLFLLDSGRGGTGTTWNWKLLGARAPKHVFIAGGIDPDNVGELMKLKPFGIDLAGGVESSPGVKDAGKLHALFAAIGGAA